MSIFYNVFSFADIVVKKHVNFIQIISCTGEDVQRGVVIWIVNLMMIGNDVLINNWYSG